MVATLSKNTAGTSWSLSNERSYDVWGSVRSGAATGGPKGRYVANLGHVQDDESGLIYMRARYYEPETGRFVSEDPAGADGNWYSAFRNSPTNYADPSGKSSSMLIPIILAYYAFGALFWSPDSAEGKMLKLLIDSTLAVLACVEGLHAIAKHSDPRMRLTGAEISSTLALTGVGLVACVMAAYQIGLMAYMAFGEGDFDMLGASVYGSAGDPHASAQNGINMLLHQFGAMFE